MIETPTTPTTGILSNFTSRRAKPAPAASDRPRDAALSAIPLDRLQVSIHDDIDALPEPALALLKEEGRDRFMNGLHWYRTFAGTCLDEGQTPRFYVVAARDEPDIQLVMPMITPLGRPGSRISERQLGERSLMAMTNHQSRYFAPISNATPDQLDRLLEGFAAHLKREGCSVVDFNHLDPTVVDVETLRRAFVAARFSVNDYHDQTVVFDRMDGRAFADFQGGLTSKFRRNLRRQRKKLEEIGRLRFVMVQGGDQLADAIRDYEVVQQASWKPDEAYPRHMPTLIEAAAEADGLRLALLYLDDRPVAADLSFVSGDFAYGHKGHYDEAFRQHGVGDVMTIMALEHLIDVDKAEVVDFGKNADRYKLKWLKQQRQLNGLVAFNPATAEGQLRRLIYRTRRQVDPRLSALKRQFLAVKDRLSLFVPGQKAE